ncbi:glycoside hydrolase family 95 protein [Paenibacillus camelliae]|uniref:glycoside hydrolase family 95 protein n=1 Tax=Paenibacillus camelliae TaxID=512410 RepID=UPI00203B12D1|nr:glycoside hydrolase family 95 protein [Paenibacillus camelliae]MCM3632330.1 glycoside hydrolase family 95 protein [Paenibacillus camelliae]
MNRNDQQLYYTQPANEWEEALPIGNGRIGAMVFGSISCERLQLNEDTLWSGFPRDTNNYEALRYLKQSRELIAAGKYAEAEALIEQKMLALNCQAYQPFGDLFVTWLNAPEQAARYKRGLDLETAVAFMELEADGARYTRQAWVSVPHQIFALTYRSEGKAMDLEASFSLPHPSNSSSSSQDYTIEGRCPTHIADNYFGDHPYAVQYEEDRGIIFQSKLRALSDGSVEYTAEGIKVKDATYVHFIGSIATSFTAFDEQPHQHYSLLSKDNLAVLDAIKGYTYEELMDAHRLEHQRLYKRMSFTLGRAEEGHELPTDERLARYKQGAMDLGLESLYFNYGRYLLITSSRPGTQPANLQGIWNHRVQPPWNSDYTTNINTEMNYWPAELLSLSECHEPLLQMIEELAETGARTAKIHYKAEGWVAHHNVDIWRMSSPTGGHPSWAFWPMGGVWLTQHLWERYLFHPDLDYLKEKAYPLLKGAAQFCLDWLIEDEQGQLITSPSTSPENKFVYDQGKVSSVAQASAMDMTLIRELFEHVIEASELLNEDEPFRTELSAALEKMVKLKVNDKGLLQEWDVDFEEHEPGHRHVSHLYGLYPGTTIQQPELIEAARQTLSSRISHGGGHTGWSCAWLINLYARLGMKEDTYTFIRTLLERSTYTNLFDAHPPFQIDGNFGGIAGMAEALVQSHRKSIELLPTLPEPWEAGEVSGLMARGGFKLSIQWEDSKLTEATILSLYGKPLQLSYKHSIVIIDATSGISYNGNEVIETVAGHTYRVQLA